MSMLNHQYYSALVALKSCSMFSKVFFFHDISLLLIIKLTINTKHVHFPLLFLPWSQRCSFFFCFKWTWADNWKIRPLWPVCFYLWLLFIQQIMTLYSNVTVKVTKPTQKYFWNVIVFQRKKPNQAWENKLPATTLIININIISLLYWS